MSNFCKTQLCTTVQNTVNATTCASTVEDILFNSISADKIDPINRVSEIVYNDLPLACTVPNGHIAYLEDAFVPVISSNCAWIGLDGRTIGTCSAFQVWAWGVGSCGRLGNNLQSSSCSPVWEISRSENWCAVNGGQLHTAAVKSSGEIWSWGSNNAGQLGIGASALSSFGSPVRESCSATNWCQVGAGAVHTAAINTSGELWTWGCGYQGRLGDGTITNRCSPVREFCSATDWCQVSAGNNHSAAIKTSGELWAWGCNQCGALGNGATINSCSPVREICSATNWCQVSVGGFTPTSTAIKTSGELWTWGWGGSGRIGDGTYQPRCSPVREFCSATDWCQVCAGQYHTSMVKTSGQLWAWGCNACGTLGNGSTVNVCSPVREICSATDWCGVSAGSIFSSAIKTSGEIWSWGRNYQGRLGNGTQADSCSPVREISSSTDWCRVGSGTNHTTAIKIYTCVCR